MSVQSIEAVSGLVALNSLMAMVGGVLAALFFGRNDPGFVHNGPLAGLVAIRPPWVAWGCEPDGPILGDHPGRARGPGADMSIHRIGAESPYGD